MKRLLLLAALPIFAACGPVTITTSDTLTEEQLENFFKKHKIGKHHAVAIKRRFTAPAPGGTAYLATIHGYPNNLSVCEELIAPYNKDPSLSAIPGGYYYCDILR
jgi:hypothetical protein